MIKNVAWDILYVNSHSLKVAVKTKSVGSSMYTITQVGIDDDVPWELVLHMQAHKNFPHNGYAEKYVRFSN